MQNFNNFMSLTAELQANKEAFDQKPTKVRAKEMRRLINELKKLATAAKSDLMEV